MDKEYHLEDIVSLYKAKCHDIYQQKIEYLSVYETGIISKIQQDYNTNKIINADQYFAKINQQYQDLEKMLNQELQDAIKKETTKFSEAISAYFLLDNYHQYQIHLNQHLIDDIKKQCFEQKEISSLEEEVNHLIKEVEALL